MGRRKARVAVVVGTLAALAAVGAPAQAQGGGHSPWGGGAVLRADASSAAQARAGSSAQAVTGASAPRVLARHLVGPLSLAVSGTGTVYVAQSFAGSLTVVGRGGALRDLVVAPGREVGGVSVGRHGSVTYTVSAVVRENANLVKVRARNGRTVTLADTLAYEKRANPDRNRVYGFADVAPGCVSPGGEIPPFAAYTGQIDSHAYATATTRGGTRYIADAGGNDILRLRHGRLSTVAVLPSVLTRVTAQAAAALHLPSCIVGAAFIAEPVPTDVEIGPHGQLYVTSLPGGPEDATLGARGSVYRINPRTGSIRRLATGFLGATDVAVSANGTVYVTELFGDKITRISRSGRKSTVLSAPGLQPAAIELSHGRLYATTHAFGDGQVISLRP